MFPRINRLAGSSHRAAQFDRLVSEVVEQSMLPVRRRMSGIAATMGPAELRGYVRARAARPVRNEAQQLLTRRHLPDSLLDDLVHRAVERTVHLLVCEATAQPVVSLPAAHVRLRAAA